MPTMHLYHGKEKVLFFQVKLDIGSKGNECASKYF